MPSPSGNGNGADISPCLVLIPWPIPCLSSARFGCYGCTEEDVRVRRRCARHIFASSANLQPQRVLHHLHCSFITANKAKSIRSITSCVRNSLYETPASPNTHTFAELVEHGDAFRRTPALPSAPCAALGLHALVPLWRALVAAVF